MADENQDQKRIADLSQEQLGVSQAQFGKINAQNEALGAVILELAAAQAQAGDIEERQIKREKFYRRRDFIFNQVVAQFQRISAKKAAIAAENQANRDLIEQEAQVDTGIAVAKNTNMLTTLTEFMQRDIARLSDFMMGNKLAEEENRREMLAALKDTKVARGKDFKGKKYQGFLKTLGKILLGVPFFLIGFFQGYFQQLGKVLKGFANVSKWIDNKVFSGFFTKLGTAIKGAFTSIGARISVLLSKVTKNKAVAKGIEFIKNIATRVSGFFQVIQSKIAGSKGFARFLKFASKAKALGNIFGKIFLPLKRILGVFSFVKGFMKGKKEGGIVEGIKQGLFALYDTLVGSVVELAGKLLKFLVNISFGALNKIGGLVSGLLGNILKVLGFEKAGEQIKSSFASIIEGFKNVFLGLIDLVVGIFTFDKEKIGESLGKIWDGIKGILMSPINLFKSIMEDLSNSLKASLNAVKNTISKLNPFSKSNEEIQAEIEKERARINRSQSGEDEYLGRESKGIAKSQKKIAELEKQLAQNGAEMAAREKQNADLKAMAVNAAAGGTTINNYQVDNSQTASATTFHQGNMIDETGIPAYSH